MTLIVSSDDLRYEVKLLILSPHAEINGRPTILIYEVAYFKYRSGHALQSHRRGECQILFSHHDARVKSFSRIRSECPQSRKFSFTITTGMDMYQCRLYTTAQGRMSSYKVPLDK